MVVFPISFIAGLPISYLPAKGEPKSGTLPLRYALNMGKAHTKPAEL
jgi:hypothetical protein